jgi:hypothetical protein
MLDAINVIVSDLRGQLASSRQLGLVVPELESA